MNCTICGKSTMPGAMLCAPCKAALKRARYVTVQEDMRRPSIIDARRTPRRAQPPEPARQPPPASPEPVALPDVPPPSDALPNSVLARRIYMGVFVAAVALGGASYFGQRAVGAHAGNAAVAAPVTADESPVNTATPVAVAQPPPQVVVVPPAAVASKPAPIAAEPAPPAAKSAALSGKRAVARSSASVATVNGDPPDAWNPPPEPPKIAVAPVPPPPAVVPDRWQSLRDSIAQCDREGMIAGIICGQKARIQYCEGYWGKVPQCPGPTANPER